MRKIDKIVIHCSDSEYGTARLIDEWHRKRGWSGIGYHYVIMNAYPDRDSFRERRPVFRRDGCVRSGRGETEVGAHVRGHNCNSIGICLIGRDSFTAAQFSTLKGLIANLKTKYPDAEVVGHYELLSTESSGKTCPNIDMEWLRNLL